jgi:hypothetical protein
MRGTPLSDARTFFTCRALYSGRIAVDPMARHKARAMPCATRRPKRLAAYGFAQRMHCGAHALHGAFRCRRAQRWCDAALMTCERANIDLVLRAGFCTNRFVRSVTGTKHIRAEAVPRVSSAHKHSAASATQSLFRAMARLLHRENHCGQRRSRHLEAKEQGQRRPHRAATRADAIGVCRADAPHIRTYARTQNR